MSPPHSELHVYCHISRPDVWQCHLKETLYLQCDTTSWNEKLWLLKLYETVSPFPLKNIYLLGTEHMLWLVVKSIYRIYTEINYFCYHLTNGNILYMKHMGKCMLNITCQDKCSGSGWFVPVLGFLTCSVTAHALHPYVWSKCVSKLTTLNICIKMIRFY